VTEDDSASMVEAAGVDALVEQISGLPSDWHAAGTLGAEVILAISETLRQRGLIGRLSAETGCGKSTLLLSHLSGRHYCFAVGARDNSLERVRRSPLLRQESVEFIVGGAADKAANLGG